MKRLDDLSDEELLALRDRARPTATPRQRPVSEWSDEELLAGSPRRTPAVDPLTAFGRGAADGVTFGWGDEALGGLRGLDSWWNGGDFDDAYGESVRASRDRQQEAQDDQGGWYLGGQFAGSAAPFLVPGLNVAAGGARGGAMARFASEGLLKRTLASGATGGMFGALSGAGHAEDDEKLQGAMSGGVRGAGMGAAIPVGFSLLGQLGKVFARGAEAPVANIVGPHGTGPSPGYGGPAANVSNEALDDFLSGLRQSGHTPESALQYIDDALTDPGRGRTFVDMFGRTGVKRMKLYNKSPGETANAAEYQFGERSRGALDRLEQTLGGQSAFAARQEIDRLKGEIGETMYDELFSRGGPGGAINTASANWPRMQTLLTSPRFQPVLREAQDFAELEAQVASTEGRQAPPPINLVEDPATGALAFSAPPTARDLHVIKMALDGNVSSLLKRAARGEDGVASSTVPLVTQLRNWYRNALDDGTENAVVPGYKAARAAYGGQAEADEAIDRGLQLLTGKKSLEEEGDFIASLTPWHRENMNLALRDEMRTILSTADKEGRRNIADSLLSTQKQRLMGLVFGRDEAENIRRALSTESFLHRIGQQASPAHGSDTGVFIAEGLDQALRDMPRGPMEAIWQAGKDVLGQIFGRIREGRMNEAGKLLLQVVDDPATAPEVRAFLARAAQRAAERIRDAQSQLTGPFGAAPSSFWSGLSGG